MFIKKENREQVEAFHELLDYFGVIDDGVALLSSGGFVAAWEVVGHDMDSATLAANYYRAVRFANEINLGPDFGVCSDLIREPLTQYPDSSPEDWPDCVSCVIDAERREQFTAQGNYWRNRYYFYLTYRPAQTNSSKTGNWFFNEVTSEQEQTDAQRLLARFLKGVESFEAVQRSNMVEVRRLRCYEKDGVLYDELHRYFRRCVLGQDDPFPLPEPPVFLSQMMTDDFVGGSEPMLGSKYIATIAINGFPPNSYAGIFGSLYCLPFAYRFSQQSVLMGSQQAIALWEKKAKNWGAKKISFFKKYFQKDNTIVDRHAADLESEADLAKTDAEYLRSVDVFYTSKIVLMEEDRKVLIEKIKAVQEAVRPFSSRVESLNAVAAFISSLPGQMHKDTRQNHISTANLAHFLPLGAPFLGLEHNPSVDMFPPNTPPLFYASTAGRAVFKFHTHTEKDVGHALFAGPNGTGKSTFLGLGMAQWCRYPNSQVFAFDKKKTLYILTRAVGGDYYDLGMTGRSSIRLCPLSLIDTPADREQASNWLSVACQQNGLEIKSHHLNSINNALDRMAHSPSQRSLTDFQMQVDNHDIKETIEYYTLKGASGGLLDGKTDNLSISRFSVFEMEELYSSSPELMNAVMLYIIGRIRKRLTARVPTLITIDEFREALKHPVMLRAVDNFLNEGRKLNTAVWLALQDLEVAEESKLGAAIFQQCMTKIFLPNPLAIEPRGKKAYSACGLNDSDIEIIAQSQGKRDYYVTSREGKRNVTLDVGKVALAFFSSSNEEDRLMVDKMIAKNPQSWQADWLRYKGLSGSGWPDFLSEMLQQQKAMAANA